MAECVDEAEENKWGFGHASVDRCQAAKQDAFDTELRAWQATRQWNGPYIVAWCALWLVAIGIALGAGKLAAWVVTGFLTRGKTESSTPN